MLRFICKLILGFLSLGLVGCETVLPATPESQAACASLIQHYAAIRPDAVNLDEWADWDWDRALTLFGKPLGDRSAKISRSDYLETTGANRAVDPQMKRSAEQSFERWDHGHKGYIEWADTRQNDRAAFSRRDTNHDGWVTLQECAVRIIPPPPWI